MSPLRHRALMALCAVAGVCSLSGRPVAQEKPGAIALLDQYASGQFDTVVAVLEGTEKGDFDGIFNDLKKHGPEWVAQGGAGDVLRRRLAAATFALEAARAGEWLDWKRITAVPSLSRGRVLGDPDNPKASDLRVGGDGFKNADLIYWQPAPQILEWGCAIARTAAWPDATQRLWQLAALAVAERAEDFEFIIGSPFESRGNANDEFHHLHHAAERLPDERRVALAQGIALEWRSFPEQNKGRALLRPGVAEAEQTFAALSSDDVVGGEATMRLGVLRYRVGETDAALKLFTSAEEKTRDPFVIYLARYFRGQALERKKDWAEAEAAYRSALTAIPKVQSASIALGALLAKRGARAEAEAVVAANLSARPQPADPWRIYGDGDDRFWPELITRLRQKIVPELRSGVNSDNTSLAPTSGVPPTSLASVLTGPAVTVPQRPAPQTPVFRANADVVTVGVAVRASGSPVGGLRADDFVVLDNGVPQKIESIDSEAVPADITVLVETGEDIRDYFDSVQTQLKRILALVRPDDRVRVLAMDTYVTELLPLQRAGDRAPIDKVSLGRYVSAHDALAAALIQASDPQRRQLIIAVTDAVDGNSTLTAETVRDLAKQSSAELHIAYVTLACECPGPYMTTAERLGRVRTETGGQRSRFWRPYHQPADTRTDHDMKVIREAAEVTGGKAYLPGIFTDRTAAGVFQKVYDDYRHSYVIRYTPQGVKREGWHELTVTLPKRPGVEITARRGYGIDVPEALTRANEPALAPPDYDTISNAIRRAADPLKAVKDFKAAGNPFPSTPGYEAVLALELAEKVFRTGQDKARDAAVSLLVNQRQLVQRAIEADEFERLWLWAATAILESPIRPALGEAFVDAALVRLPNEPRLLLARAVLADQRIPVGTLEQPDPGPAAASRVLEITRLYDEVGLDPNAIAEARVRKGWFLHRMGHHAEAMAVLDDAAPRANDAVLNFWRDLFRGQTLDALGKSADAITAFREALARFPNSQSANIALMNTLMRTGAHTEAQAIAARIQQFTAGDDDPYWSYWAADFRFRDGAITRLRQLAAANSGAIK